MNYAKGIRRARERAKLSMRKLAQQAGFDPSYVGLLESARRLPSLGTLEAIAKATDVPLGLLMLMSSERDDLVGIDTKEARTLALKLKDLIDATTDDD